MKWSDLLFWLVVLAFALWWVDSIHNTSIKHPSGYAAWTVDGCYIQGQHNQEDFAILTRWCDEMNIAYFSK
jgi:hypothetical protein